MEKMAIRNSIYKERERELSLDTGFSLSLSSCWLVVHIYYFPFSFFFLFSRKPMEVVWPGLEPYFPHIQSSSSAFPHRRRGLIAVGKSETFFFFFTSFRILSPGETIARAFALAPISSSQLCKSANMEWLRHPIATPASLIFYTLSPPDDLCVHLLAPGHAICFVLLPGLLSLPLWPKWGVV